MTDFDSAKVHTFSQLKKKKAELFAELKKCCTFAIANQGHLWRNR